MNVLQGRVALITGAAHGIGRVCATACAEAGAAGRGTVVTVSSGAGVRANVVCPGPVNTESPHASPNHDYHVAHGHSCLEPSDVVGAILYLSSAESGAINGQLFSVRDSSRW